MGRNAGTGGGILSSDEALYDRLSPAEAHDIVRRKLQRMADSWALTSADVHRLARQMHIRRYIPGEIILPRRVRADCLGLVVQGQVAVHVSQRRRARPIVVLLSGSTFGEAMLVEGRSSAVTLQALTHCEIWFVRRAQVTSLVGERQTARRVALLTNLVAWGGLVLALWFVLLLLLILPSTRQAFALVPMAIGQLCRQQGYDTCAEQTWSVSANLAPKDISPLLALGGLYFEQDAIATAEQYFDAARAVVPDSPEVLNNLGLIYARQGEHERAIGAFKHALELEPGVAAVESNLARSLQAVDNYEEALAHYRLAVSLGSSNASTWANMAIAYLDADRPDEAEDAAGKALRYDDDLAPVHTVLGAVALEARKPDEALVHLHRAIALDGAYGQAHFYLGLVYKSLQQPSDAVAAFERALTTAPDETTRVQIRGHLNELYESERPDSTR